MYGLNLNPSKNNKSVIYLAQKRNFPFGIEISSETRFSFFFRFQNQLKNVFFIFEIEISSKTKCFNLTSKRAKKRDFHFSF